MMIMMMMRLCLDNAILKGVEGSDTVVFNGQHGHRAIEGSVLVSLGRCTIASATACVILGCPFSVPLLLLHLLEQAADCEAQLWTLVPIIHDELRSARRPFLEEPRQLTTGRGLRGRHVRTAGSRQHTLLDAKVDQKPLLSLRLHGSSCWDACHDDGTAREVARVHTTT